MSHHDNPFLYGRHVERADEFGEVLNVPGEPDALMRSAFQASPDVSFLFMGSKRSLMDGLFSDRRRPFYNFGRRMELGRLSYEPHGEFVEGRFEAADEETALAARDEALDEAEPEFRAILDEMSSPGRLRRPLQETDGRAVLETLHASPRDKGLRGAEERARRARCVWLPGEVENWRATRADRSSAGPLDPRADERFLGVGP